MSLIETKKYNKKDCVNEFVRDLIQGNGVENFRKYSLNGELDKYHIRGMAWKIFMEVLPETETLEQWVESIDKLRKEYKTKAKSLLKTQKFKGDPLSGMAMSNSDSSTWGTYYADNDKLAVDALHEIFPNTIVAPYFATPMEAKSYISGMDLFIGARMHATIAAISAGVPVIPFSYS